MTKIQIHITKDIIRRSKMCRYDDKGYTVDNCAIAKAIREIFPTAYVGLNSVIYPDVPHAVSMLPDEACKFIHVFDNSTPSQRLMLPEFTFIIEIPDEVIDMINIDEIKRICESSTSLSLINA